MTRVIRGSNLLGSKFKSREKPKHRRLPKDISIWMKTVIETQYGAADINPATAFIFCQSLLALSLIFIWYISRCIFRSLEKCSQPNKYRSHTVYNPAFDTIVWLRVLLTGIFYRKRRKTLNSQSNVFKRQHYLINSLKYLLILKYFHLIAFWFLLSSMFWALVWKSHSPLPEVSPALYLAKLKMWQGEFETFHFSLKSVKDFLLVRKVFFLKFSWDTIFETLHVFLI